MEVLYQHLENSIRESFLSVHVRENHYNVPLHYHPEIEIMYIVKGSGVRIVGDNISNYSEGELVIVGSDISHVWKRDLRNFNTDNEPLSERIVLFIGTNQFLNNMFELPEFMSIKKMLKNSVRGIKFEDDESKKFKRQILTIVKSSGLDKFQKVISLLHDLSNNSTFEYISQINFGKESAMSDSSRLNKCIEYISDNYYRKIDLDKISEIANLTPNSFCRYFKKRTTKTFSQYVTDIRINKACQLLISTNSKIVDISFESGFNSLSNFNNHFNKSIGVSPKIYRNKNFVN